MTYRVNDFSKSFMLSFKMKQELPFHTASSGYWKSTNL